MTRTIGIVVTTAFIAFVLGGLTSYHANNRPAEQPPAYQPLIAECQDGTWFPLDSDDEDKFIAQVQRAADFQDEAIAVTQGGKLVCLINPKRSK